VRALLLDEDPPPERLPFIGRFESTTTQADKLVADIRETLAMTLDHQRAAPTTEAFFKSLRDRVQEVGIFVQLQATWGATTVVLIHASFVDWRFPMTTRRSFLINSNDSHGAKTSR